MFPKIARVFFLLHTQRKSVDFRLLIAKLSINYNRNVAYEKSQNRPHLTAL